MAASSLTDRLAASLAADRRWKPAEIALWAAAVIAPFLLPRQLLLLNEIAILALFALSLDLILGFAGIVSLGHAAFLDAGAYAAGLFAMNVSPEPFSGLLVGSLVAGVLGLLTSPLVLRGTDLTRLMVTLGVALVMLELANTFSDLTGGADGLQGITIDPLFGRFDFDMRGQTAYAYSLAVLFVLFLVARRVMKSPFGLSLRAIRDNRLRASASGVRINQRIVIVYTLAAAYAGAAGALMAQSSQFVSLDVLDFHRSADLMLVLIIGGAGYLYGGIVGAVVFKILQDVFAILTPEHWEFFIGLFLVVFILWGRDLVCGGLARLVRRRPVALQEKAT